MNSGISDNFIQPEDIPVLVTIFNRPDKTRAVMENLARIKPRRLFIAADGPRDACPDDIEKCRQARREATVLDWPCEVSTRFLDGNLGCDPAVASAIDWFFRHVEYGVIFEDDCIVHPHFFALCGELFVRYADDRRIMQISSLSPYAARQHPYDYHFSRMFRCSGCWGTWRRAWEHFTDDMGRYGDDDARAFLTAYIPDRTLCRQFYRKFLDFKRGAFNNWDFQWNIACYAQNGLSVVPERNLMNNIGFGEDSTHTQQMNPVFENLRIQPLDFPLRHPPLVYADNRPERSLERKIYGSLPLKSRCAYVARRALGAVSYLRGVMPFHAE